MTARPLNLLITGYPGWISSRLVDRIRESATLGGLPIGRIRCLAEPGRPGAPDGVETAVGDLRRPETLAAATGGMDAIVHCAGVIHPRRISDFYAINRDGTGHVIEQACAAGVRRVVFLSTNSVQGFCPRGGLLTENGHGAPASHYARSKWEAEETLREAHERRRIETVVLRPSTFYGPGLPDRMQRVYHMVRSGRPIVFGDGRNRISMCHLDHLVQAIELAVTVPAAAGGTYFIADERPYEVLEILAAIAEAFGVRLSPRHVPAAVSTLCSWADRAWSALGRYGMDIHVAGEMTKEIAVSIEKARGELGYRPTIALREGVAQVVEWGRRVGIFPT